MHRTFAVFMICLSFLSCQMDNRFSQLQKGMTKEQVMKIVQKRPTGDKMQGDMEVLQWETGSHYAKFKNGRLMEYGSE